MGVVIAAGPYTHSDGLTYEPLQSLVRYVKEHKPHLLILCGPFIDSAQQNVQDSMMEGSYEQFFLRLITETLAPLARYIFIRVSLEILHSRCILLSLSTKIVVVSSSRDAHHIVVYPTPPFALSAAERRLIPDNVLFVSDPCLLDVDGLVIAVTSTDVLKHLGPSEISRY
jgi:DNA polymerase alpha subunit B